MASVPETIDAAAGVTDDDAGGVVAGGVVWDDFFPLLAASETKLEYHHGRVIEMAGGKSNHEILCAALMLILGRVLDLKAFFPFAGAGVADREFAYYFPDVVVAAKPLQWKRIGGVDHLAEPVVVAEVLSPSTQRFDRGEKFATYTAMGSVRVVLLIAADEPRVEVFVRSSGTGNWGQSAAEGTDGSVDVPLAGESVVVPMGELYADVDLTAGGPAAAE